MTGAHRIDRHLQPVQVSGHALHRPLRIMGGDRLHNVLQLLAGSCRIDGIPVAGQLGGRMGVVAPADEQAQWQPTAQAVMSSIVMK